MSNPSRSPNRASSSHALAASAIFRPLSSPAYNALTTSATDSTSPTPPPASPPLSPQSSSQTRPPSHVSPANPPPPPPAPDDLGDDDSFAPDIVSGYHFNLPLALESTPSPPVPPQPSATTNNNNNITNIHIINSSSSNNNNNNNNNSSHPSLHSAPVVMSPIDVVPCAPAAPSPPLDMDHLNDFPHVSESTPAYNAHHEHLPDTDRDHDHRTDGVYDHLDDIGDWVATAGPGHNAAHLASRLTRAVNAPRASSAAAPAAQQSAAAQAASAALASHNREEQRRRENHASDKVDRATVEQALDPRTRMILFRLLSRNRLRTLDGCVSTGKEANVYYATASSVPNALPDANGAFPPSPGLAANDTTPDAAVAVKVFKTSILQFKDRERYVAGEFRFRRGGYQRGSNRKMVQQWAEKEFRNQMRLQEAGIPAPIPLLLKPPVLIMSFFGKEGWPAPRLKEANLSPARLAKAYFTVCLLMRRMFRVAHLVHGDLSEYNMLYNKGEVVIIDVSQSVEDDHPMALDFLRRDCANVNDFFRRSGVVAVLGVRELFDFVTGEHIGDSQHEQESALTALLDGAASRDLASTRIAREDDEVFMRAYIPRTLQDVPLTEQQFLAKPGEGPDEDSDSNLFAKLTGLSVTQKRERLDTSAVSKVTSASVGGSGLTAVDVHVTASSPCRLAEDVEDTPDLEVPCIEPATFRRLPSKEQQRIGTSSPCTSNSSSRPQVDDRREGARRSVRPEPGWAGESDLPDDAQDEEGSTYDGEEDSEDEGGITQDGVDTYDGVNECGSSGDVGWARRDSREEADPFMGMTRKEWKKKVKAEARERREHKVPKHVKKRKETLAKRRRGNK